MLGCIFTKRNDTIKSRKANPNNSKPKEAKSIDPKPIILHIDKMLEDFEEAPLRAVYMVVKELHELQTSKIA